MLIKNVLLTLLTIYILKHNTVHSGGDGGDLGALLDAVIKSGSVPLSYKLNIKM